MTSKEKIEEAKRIGIETANKGGSIVPCLCKDLMKLLEGEPVGGNGIKIMKAFQIAFINAPIDLD